LGKADVSALGEVGSSERAPGVRHPARDGLLVFLVLLAFTVLLFALPVVPRLGNSCVGACVRDFRLYVWSMDWLSYAVSHGVDPFRTAFLWAPSGTSLTWVTTLPVPALAMLPVTFTLGPVAAANVLLVLAPPLAGWAMFLVCREITHRPLPAFFGAMVFAFSTYVGHLMRAQLNLLLMFWFPLAIYLFLRNLNGSMSQRRFVVLLALVLCGEFLTSTEVFAMMTFCAGIAWVVFWLAGPKELRSRLVDALIPVASAYGVAALLLSPLLIPTLQTTPTVVLRPLEQNSADLLGPIIPGVSTSVGSGLFSSLSDRFLDPDNFAYIGLPFLFVVVAFALGARKRKGAWPLVVLFLIFVSLAMGPRLHILGQRNLWLPGFFVSYLPLIQHAVPVRYVLYTWLVLAVIVAVWLAEPSPKPWRKYVVVGLGIVLVLPSHRSVRDVGPVYHDTLAMPTFFSDGTFRSYVQADDIVLAVPRTVGDELLWQVESDMGFRLASAYIGPTKPKNGLGNLSQEEPPPSLSDFSAQISAAGVDVIIADWPMSAEWQSFLETASGSQALIVDDVAIFRVSSMPPSP
jgi:hypothetical protein